MDLIRSAFVIIHLMSFTLLLGWKRSIPYNGCNDFVTVTFDSLLIRGLNEADLWVIIAKFSYVA